MEDVNQMKQSREYLSTSRIARCSTRRTAVGQVDKQVVCARSSCCQFVAYAGCTEARTTDPNIVPTRRMDAEADCDLHNHHLHHRRIVNAVE